MYINNAYLGKKSEVITDLTLPLLITAAGRYHVHTKEVFKSSRPNGRKDYLIIYVAEGKLHLFANDEEQIVQKGNMILFPPGAPQIYKLFAKDHPKIYWVHFTGNDVEKILQSYNIPCGTNVFFTGISPNYKQAFLQMIQELKLKRANYMDILIHTMHLLFLYISRNIDEGTLVTADLLNEIEQAMLYFNKNFYMPIVIETYAKEHHMTSGWFIQNFKKIAQATPAQYILELRINNAMGLLVDTNYPIAQIAATVGYEDSHYFSRLFAKHVGMSPMEYRKSKGEKQ